MALDTTSILGLPVAVALDGSEYAPLVQGGTTKRAQVSAFNLTGTLPGSVQSANTVFSGPASGAVAFPTFRALVSADIPNSLVLGVAGTSLGSLGLSGNTSGVVTIKPQAAAGTFNFNLPTSAGTSGYVLTSGGGGSSPMTWVNPTSLGIDLDVGSTAITGGTTTRVLYDNAGVLGEYSAVPATVGGTGFSSYTVGDLLYASSTTVLSKLAASTSGYHLQAAGAGVAPAWAGFLQAGTGAVTRTWQDKSRDAICAKDFGAVLDGATDDRAAIQAAIDYAATTIHRSVYIPGGTAILGSTGGSGYCLTNTSSVRIYGDSAGTNGTVLRVTVNAAAFKPQTECTIEDLKIVGDLDGAKTAQYGVYIPNVNLVSLRRVMFTNLYDSIHVTEGAFYIRIQECQFFDNINAHIYGAGSAASGYDLTVCDCNVIQSAGTYCWYFENAGSLLFTNNRSSPATATANTLRIVSQATNAGEFRFTACVFEGSVQENVRLDGGSGTEIQNIYFNSCYINQSGSFAAFRLNFVKRLQVSGCYIGGISSGFNLVASGQLTGATISNCIGNQVGKFFVSAASSTVAGLAISNVENVGNTNAFLDLSLSTSASKVFVVGCDLGTNATPIVMPSGYAANVLVPNRLGILQSTNATGATDTTYAYQLYKSDGTTALVMGYDGTNALIQTFNGAALHINDQGNGVFIGSSLQLPNNGLKVLDTNASHTLTISPGSDITANRTLTLTTGDSDRTITLSGSPTLADWFDQSVKTSASPTFVSPTLTTSLLANSGFVINVASSNWVATHTSGILTVGTGDFRVTTAGTNSASVVTVGGTQTLTNKTLTSPTLTTPNLGAATGTSYNIGGVSLIAGALLQVAGGRSFFAPNSEVFAVSFAYNSTRLSAGQGCYFGATDSATPDFIVSNVGGTEIFRSTTGGVSYSNSASFLHGSKTTLTDGAGTATLGAVTNGPGSGARGNPKWLPIDDNGTTRYVAAYTTSS